MSGILTDPALTSKKKDLKMTPVLEIQYLQYIDLKKKRTTNTVSF